MKSYLKTDPWLIIEEGFDPADQLVSESIFSLGNGRFGQRGNFEEQYSGESLQGNYFGGIYYPDKTRVGWWKIGYPEYFAKVLNAVDWAGIRITMDGVELDLHQITPQRFVRTLDMRRGLLCRTFELETESGTLSFAFERFCSMDAQDTGAVRLRIASQDFSGRITLHSYLNWDVVNQDANWDEKFWLHRQTDAGDQYCRSMAETKKTGFVICSAATWNIAGIEKYSLSHTAQDMFCSNDLAFDLSAGNAVTFDKFAVHHSTLHFPAERLYAGALEEARACRETGYQVLRDAHVEAWARKWQGADVEIAGDQAAQQGIRFNIFQLLQTYTGDDPRLNIGPKGFTGEKYGGSTYWDTEAYCLPFYLGTCDESVGRQLLEYRYRHLPKAIENAEKLGFSGGAALYPMVTMNGEECHNEWEITFEEIHRNGAIAYAIYDFIRYTGDGSYLTEGGLEVLIGIARFWAQRVSWSERKEQYVMLGVTGPNEYENNVDNNWYTNYIARWCLKYTRSCIDDLEGIAPKALEAIVSRTGLTEQETRDWALVAEKLYLPYDEERQIFLQQDNYLEKVQMTTADLPAEARPLNQNWSWDRILRSCFIKQADVLQGLYFFADHFDRDTILRNFLFYEPRTVHESSLSPCVHSILAASLGMADKAYEMYLRTSRLDLDNYNNDTDDGLHITSMAGTWLAVIKGFAGLTVRDGALHFHPALPAAWERLSFHLRFRRRILSCTITREGLILRLLEGKDIAVFVHGASVVADRAGEATVSFTEIQ